jgi:hypothetical protein
MGYEKLIAWMIEACRVGRDWVRFWVSAIVSVFVIDVLVGEVLDHHPHPLLVAASQHTLDANREDEL